MRFFEPGYNNIFFLPENTGDVWKRNQVTASGNRQVTTLGCGQGTQQLDVGKHLTGKVMAEEQEQFDPGAAVTLPFFKASLANST